MHKLLLFRPISRAVRVQRPVTCYRLLNKSFSATTCRKFGTTLTQRMEEEPSPPSPPAEEVDVVQNDINMRELLGNESFPVHFIDDVVLSSYNFP
jgi:hypothetical protein